MRFSFEVSIPAARERVFDYLGDPANRPHWQRSITSFELEAQGKPQVGVHWRESVRGGITFEMEISVYERPSRWAERIRSPSHEGSVTLFFREDDGGTVVRLEADVRAKGLWRLVDPIGAFVLKREMRKDLRGVAAQLAVPR